MTIATRQLFGSIGQPRQSLEPEPATARPGYGAWYARQMTRSYSERRAPPLAA